MNYNIKDITQYFENCKPFEGHFTEDDVDDFISSIPAKVGYYDYDLGATKMVIIPEDTEYVIKIPFTGQYTYNSPYYDEDLKEWVESEYENYVDFCGAFSEWGNNYIEAEIRYYNMAEEAGWAEYFLPIEYVYDWDGIPIYIQQKADLFCSEGEHEQVLYSSKENREKCLSIRNLNHTKWLELDKFPISWVASLMDKMKSFDKVKSFVDFLIEKTIYNDLHYSNIGYANGHAVIVDYGGYYDD